MTILSTHAEVEQLFIHLELKGCKSICMTSDKASSGTTSLAMALTERYLLAGYRTLYVDFNLFNPSFKPFPLVSIDSFTSPAQSNAIELVEHIESHQVFSGISAPIRRPDQMPYRDPVSLSGSIIKWQDNYDRIVFDTTPLTQCNQANIPTPVIASCCDATTLVVAGGLSSSEDVQYSLEQLSSCGCPFVGVALNHFRQQSFLEAILTSNSLPRWLPNRIKNKLKSAMQQNSLFHHAI
ncbi:chromosome partitioning protein ParA [Vibrio maerlii]|uniref:chromosome partitioning protein ParA n=1 Tax=Vibrio maerlii TaxID=2231648 RepID=UPI000E3DCE3A|nr:chromosome partitioning protein ParA [Vibrio maerlii]